MIDNYVYKRSETYLVVLSLNNKEIKNLTSSYGLE